MPTSRAVTREILPTADVETISVCNATLTYIVFLHIYSEVSVDDVRQAIQSVDPEAPAEVVDKYLGRAFNVAVDQLETGTKIETTLLIKRLQSGSVRRLGAKPK